MTTDLRTCTICHREGLDTYHQVGQEDANVCGDCILKHHPCQFAIPPGGLPVYQGWLDNFPRSPDQIPVIAGLRWSLQVVFARVWHNQQRG